MFKTNAVFVLGAGASKEANFPLGSELKDQIANALNFEHGAGPGVIRGDPVVAEAVDSCAGKAGENRFVWRAASRKISGGMPLALSIDNFLHAHQHDHRLVMAGKLAITRSILRAERSCPLRPDLHTAKQTDFRQLQNTWYSKFFQLLTADVSLNEVKHLFQNVSIISFNYDRSLEQFLFFALQAYYLISDDTAAELVRSLKIVHPYGTVGMLPWQGKAGVPFGGTDEPRELIEVAAQIQTFSEASANPEVRDHLHDWLEKAATVVFLGFAFHEINMRLLQLEVPNASRKIYATAVGISADDCEIIHAEARQCLCSHSTAIRVLPDVNSSSLFDRHWRAFNAL